MQLISNFVGACLREDVILDRETETADYIAKSSSRRPRQRSVNENGGRWPNERPHQAMFCLNARAIVIARVRDSRLAVSVSRSYEAATGPNRSRSVN